LAALLALLFGTVAAVFQNPSGSWRLNWDLSEDVPYEETGFSAPPELLMPIESIVLSVTETSVTFYDNDGTKRKYLLSEKRAPGSFRGFDVYTRARWNGRTVRLEVSPEPGLVVVETYAVDRNPNHLRLDVAVLQAGHRVGPGIRYVYDSVLTR
jgi:hypothetical protein